MAESDLGPRNPEDFRIVLVSKDNKVFEVNPSQEAAAPDVFSGLRRTLVDGVDTGLFDANPFLLERSSKPAISKAGGEPKKEELRQVKPPQYYPAISLDGELERQRVEGADRVAVPLGIDRNKFLAKLPSRFPQRGKDYDKSALSVPLIDLNLTPFGFTWYQATEAALFYDPNDPETVLKPYIYSGLQNVEAWKDPRKGVDPFPKVPHSVWVQDGTRYVEVNGLTPRDIRKKLGAIERAGDHWKGMSLTVLRPDMVKSMAWDLIGGVLASGSLPCVGWGAEPGFRYYWDDYALPYFRALVSGSEFIVA